MESLTLESFEQASEIVKKVTLPTKLVYSEYLSKETGGKIYLKPENMQYTGAYKVRGSYYKISRMSEEERERGLITASAGNHAQGVAYAAKLAGVKATVVMPVSTPLIKVNRTKSYGAEVVLYGNVFDEACAHAYELADEHGYTFVHPFNDLEVATGQGSIAMEIIKELPTVDYILVPVGGGGLISGVAFTVKQLKPSVRVYGVQAEGAPSMVNSLKDGKIECLESVHTIADGIKVKEPGEHTFEYCSKYVDGVVTVSDDEISSAILHLIEKQKLVSEGAGATPVAAVMFNKIPDIKGKKVVCLVSGGNIDVTILSRVIKRGLLKSGRSDTLTIQLEDRPGQLRDVSEIISKLGGNVVSVHHERASEDSDITDCLLRLVLETRNFDHIREIRQALTAAGFKIVNK